MLQVWSVGCRAVCHQCGRPVSVTSYFIKLFEGLVHHCQSASKRCLRCFPFVEKEVGHYLGTFLVVRLRLKVVLSPAHGSFRGPSSVDPQTSGLPILRICNNKKNCSNTSSRNLSDCDSPDSMRSSHTCHATCVSVWAPTRDTLENIFIMCSLSSLLLGCRTVPSEVATRNSVFFFSFGKTIPNVFIRQHVRKKVLTPHASCTVVCDFHMESAKLKTSLTPPRKNPSVTPMPSARVPVLILRRLIVDVSLLVPHPLHSDRLFHSLASAFSRALQTDGDSQFLSHKIRARAVGLRVLH